MAEWSMFHKRGLISLGDVLQYIDNLEQRLAKAESKIPKWIPVSEALPPCFNSVLAIRKNCTGRPYYATMYRDNNWCDIVSTEFIDVTHWMPLPEVPES